MSGAIVSIEISIPLNEVSIRRKSIKYHLNGTPSKNVIPTYSIPDYYTRRRVAQVGDKKLVVYFFNNPGIGETFFPPSVSSSLTFVSQKPHRVIYSFVLDSREREAERESL